MKKIICIMIGLLVLTGCQGNPSNLPSNATLTPLPTVVSTDTAPPPTATILPTETTSPTATISPTETITIISSSSISFELSPQKFESPETFQIALGDLDGDNDLDGVFANQRQNSSEVWLNDGSGTFVNSSQELTQYGHGAVVADFDGDNDLDAFIVCHQFLTPSQLYFNDGTGIMTASEQDLGDRGISAVEVYVLDVNGDHYPDVHVAYFSPDGIPDKIFLNDGTGTFTESETTLDEETIVWGDLDSDGDVDYFGKQWGLGYIVYLNDGTGRFTPVWEFEDSDATVGGIALADFDGDGDLDAMVTNGYSKTGSKPSRLFLNDGLGHFTDSGQSLNETLGAELAAGDIDNDGDLDIVVANMNMPNEIWLNDGSGNFSDSGLRFGKNSDLSAKPSLGDLDGDGDLDIIFGSFSIGAQVWLNTTDE